MQNVIIKKNYWVNNHHKSFEVITMSTKKYWKSLEDLNDSPELIKKSTNEFAEPIPMEDFLSGSSVSENSTPRRDFLKFLGFSVTAAALAACETPVRKVVPYVIKPEEITVGLSNWYASSFFDGHDYCEVLVKTREGRPIKVEGNKLSKITFGSTNARVQASVLSLYDEVRYTKPQKNGTSSSWTEVDKDISTKLAGIASSGGAIRILTSSITSPSTINAVGEFVKKYTNVQHISYDAISASGIIKANEANFGKAVVPTYHFDMADCIVSIGADFLSGWLSPIEYAVQYGKTRKVSPENPKMSCHHQFETTLSLTGSNADYRTGIKPSEIGSVVVSLYNAVAKNTGGSSVNGKATVYDAAIAKAAKDLVASKGKSLVVCGSNESNVQMLVNGINSMLLSYGTTIDLNNFSNTKQGNDAKVTELVAEMKAGKVAALFVANSNPIYSLPSSLGFADAIKKVQLSVSFADRPDETSSACQYVCPTHHYLEAWGDEQPKPGYYALTQPTIYPLFETRAYQESLLKWSGIETSYQEFVKSNWQNTIFTQQSEDTFFENWWMQSLHDGIRILGSQTPTDFKLNGDMSTAAAEASKGLSGNGNFEVTFYESIALGNGSQANNPWLQELPDPITKVVWDNYITMSPAQMKEMGFTTEREMEVKSDVADITINGITFKLPVYPQPGQPNGTIGIAIGYGRTKGGKIIENPEILGGANVFAALGLANGTLNYFAKAEIKKSSETYMLASTQTHHTLMGRNMVKETTLSEYKKDRKAGNEPETFKVKENGKHVGKTAEELSLWSTKEHPGFERPGHFWNMSIDLNACIGCGACIISCQAENNVPVVGKDEVRKSREMHWIRIDRYYSSDTTKENSEGKIGKIDMYGKMELPSENPEVVFQPVMCMHCNHAPCETVCPVLATTHSSEGLNQMTYNRCVGTKYCANNCPYKVRRFNWFRYHNNAKFDYNQNSELQKMVLNPDVTVRSRGVMEKCSMCVQRIQEGKLNAKKDGRRIKDGEIEMACAQGCPTNAITFGDVNDTASMVAQNKKNERTYYMLEELDVQPSVFYLTKVRNKEAGKSEA